ncbi:MAG TPA: PhnD/SsuA/transferrin family substrate-binding protein [Thermoleophilia bacterium]|nr:PhnD/SsuA/transferrin family substrate-binding protein [Thermoleophilia bacterium]
MDRLRLGTFLAPSILPVYQAVADEVGRRLGIETELVVETDHGSYADDANDVCFICGLPYVEYERRGISPAVPVAAPVLVGERYAGSPIYFSDVIVACDSPVRSFTDLRRHTWAYNGPISQSGYGITRYHLLQLGETKGFFCQTVETGSHAASMRRVARHEVDAAAIDSQVLAVALRDDPELAQSLRVIGTLGPSTIEPVVVSRRVPVRLREQITEVLLSMHRDPAVRARLAAGLVERFAAVGASSYDDIRAMVAACEAAGFMELR